MIIRSLCLFELQNVFFTKKPRYSFGLSSINFIGTAQHWAIKGCRLLTLMNSFRLDYMVCFFIKFQKCKLSKNFSFDIYCIL